MSEKERKKIINFDCRNSEIDLEIKELQLSWEAGTLDELQVANFFRMEHMKL